MKAVVVEHVDPGVFQDRLTAVVGVLQSRGSLTTSTHITSCETEGYAIKTAVIVYGGDCELIVLSNDDSQRLRDRLTNALRPLRGRIEDIYRFAPSSSDHAVVVVAVRQQMVSTTSGDDLHRYIDLSSDEGDDDAI